jgi:AraC-like DNA-binding protein
LRLRRAAELLPRQGGRRISEIAFECGFNDLSYFNRCFRRRFGLTPSAARGR